VIREEAEQLLGLADRLWTVGAPDAAKGRPRRIAHALEEWEGDHGFDHQQLALGAPDPEPEGSTLAPGDPRRRSRRGGPETSRIAAESIEDLGRNQQAVLEALEAMGGEAIDEALIRFYQARRVTQTTETEMELWPQQTESGIRTRRHELVDQGFVEDSGETEAMTTGHQAIVWRRTEKGRTDE
jgi:hypothetical protein